MAARKPAAPRKSRSTSKAAAPKVAEVDRGSTPPATPDGPAPRPGIDTPTGGFSTNPARNAGDTPAQAKKAADAASAEVQAKVDKAEEQGYFGETSDPHPNEAYSLLTGPDAPPVNPPRN